MNSPTINSQPSTIITPPTYPARPVNGGPLPKALPKTGDWAAEAKYNGWRTLVHAPTGTMFNRKGDRLSIAGEFRPALTKLRPLGFEWLDCEALERRHGIGRGTLIILDAPPHPLRLDRGEGRGEVLPSSYLQRRFTLDVACATVGLATHRLLDQPLPADQVLLAASWRWQDPNGNYAAGRLWEILQSCNHVLGCEFYEGVVAKRTDSPYPMQLRSPDQEFPFWMKHRWAF